jgi:hypothetical protein
MNVVPSRWGKTVTRSKTSKVSFVNDLSEKLFVKKVSMLWGWRIEGNTIDKSKKFKAALCAKKFCTPK